MSRSSTATGFILFAIMLGIGAPLYRVGAKLPDTQTSRASVIAEEMTSAYYPLDSKEIAKLKFNLEALRSDAGLLDLAKQKLEAARTEFEARYKEFLAGRGTLQFLLDSSTHYLESERALCANDAERIAALEKHWTFLTQIEKVNRGNYEAGRMPVKEYLESKYYRLDAELQLHEARAKIMKK